jgi:SAM-dependent methyltransferase
VTCIEVIEHVREEQRSRLISEMQRVLKPSGRLILRCPHAGVFSWLDPQNFRPRFPELYARLLGNGNRDEHYRQADEDLVWHHHFTRDELLGWLVADGRLRRASTWSAPVPVERYPPVAVLPPAAIRQLDGAHTPSHGDI